MGLLRCSTLSPTARAGEVGGDDGDAVVKNVARSMRAGMTGTVG